MVTGRPYGLRHCNRIGKFPAQTSLRARPGLDSQSCYEILADHLVIKIELINILLVRQPH